MSKINDLIKELCPNGVEYKKLDDCCKILDNKRKPVKKGERSIGEYPYYGANGIQDYVSDYIFDGTFVLVGEDGSVITDRGTPVVNWAVGKIWVNNHAHIISEKNNILIRYIYHYLQTIDVSDYIHGNIPKLNQTDFRNLKIAVPPLEVQEEIVRILDKFGALEAELEAELEARKNQYDFWRGKLLNKSDSKYKKYNITEICTSIFAGGDVPQDTLKGITSPQDDYIYPVISNGVGDNALYGYSKNYRVDVSSCVTIAARGTIGYHEVRYGKFTPIIRLITLVPDEKIITAEYLHYALYGYEFKPSGGSIPQLTTPMVKQLDLTIPSIEEQRRIVSILDRFDELINDISIGIPAEIELRRKQYKYYQNKLLNFEEV